MILLIHQLRKLSWLFLLSFLMPFQILAETKIWTGYGGDTNWANPLNWSGTVLPGIADDVWLDNSEMPLSFQIILPDLAVTIRTLHIRPSPGRNIELILPASNKVTDGFSVTGPGYGIELDAGAVFRNASGVASGESLFIADSLIIHDGARYIHQTRASHANSLLRILSIAPGTEQGIFDFDVPRASYTISVSNRVYGSLELHANALGAAVNYTCTGANPLLVRGNLRIGAGVSMSMNLSGSNGNIQVAGDFIQEGGQLNLAAGTGNQTVLRVKGDLYQSPVSVITETTSGNPYLELNGNRLQEIAMGGQIRNQVGFRINNTAGGILRLPLRLPWNLHLLDGMLICSASAVLILDTVCTISADSARLTGSYVEGPMRKLGLIAGAYFLFPVGKAGNLRWLGLGEAAGDFTVEYVREDPASLSTNLAPDLDHISKLEYWKVLGNGPFSGNAKIELSFASVQCGGVTDPQYLNVAKFQSALWENAGHSAITGNAIQGSVSSSPSDLGADAYTLASTVNLENPLPLAKIDLKVKEVLGETVFSWSIEGSEIPDHFDLYEVGNLDPYPIKQIPAQPQQKNYSWNWKSGVENGDHFFQVRMIDQHGVEYKSKIVHLYQQTGNTRLSWLITDIPSQRNQLLIQVNDPDTWSYEIFSINGRLFKKGSLQLSKGNNFLRIVPENLSVGCYIFHAMDSSGKWYSLLFVNDPH
jgi:hypothetical protein